MIIQHPDREAAVRKTQSKTPNGFEPEQTFLWQEIDEGGWRLQWMFSMAAVYAYVCVLQLTFLQLPTCVTQNSTANV